jgi:hypothetical protein
MNFDNFYCYSNRNFAPTDGQKNDKSVLVDRRIDCYRE